MSNLNARDTKAQQSSMAANLISMDGIYADLSPWDAHLVDMKVSANPAYSGKTLFELKWREIFGINVVYIQRGDRLIAAPGRNETILPYDKVGVLATDEQLQVFLPVFNAMEEPDVSHLRVDDIGLQKIVVDEHTLLKGHTIRSSGIREQTSGLIVGIQRGNTRILNPDSNTKFEWDDIVWIVGNWKKIRAFQAAEKVNAQP